jgi:hypothetical protein
MGCKVVGVKRKKAQESKGRKPGSPKEGSLGVQRKEAESPKEGSPRVQRKEAQESSHTPRSLRKCEGV